VPGDAETAIEVKGKGKGKDRIQSRDTRNLDEFQKEYPSVKRRIVVCTEPRARVTDSGVYILPYGDFIDALWNGELI